ncbi:MAG: glycoside hydrolase family 28 protein [Puia sp.]|nr:glycoside hydrolase family 28 protein [Puia sp.]
MLHKIIFYSLTVFVACSISLATGAQVYFNIRNFGAKGDGVSLDSRAINQAIDAAARGGGGTVYFPAGQYLSGSIHLKSNIHLLIDQGALLIAAPVSQENGYDEEETGSENHYQDPGHSHWHNSLIWGEDLHDISITGTGTIWGKGLYRGGVKSKQSANKSIALLRCRNVIIRDISILHGGWFAILATGVDNFTLDDVKMDTNRDGVDVDCCRNVRIANCFANTPYDDGICLKSTYALGYARATENVTITNCQVSGYDEGTLLDGTYRRTDNPKYHFAPTGRIKMGTESNGGFKNITISNCVFDYCGGLALETVDGALLEDVAITNITMRDINNDPIFLRLGARMRGPADVPVGALRRVTISNIVVYNADSSGACTISGIPGHAIEDVQISHVSIYYLGGGRPDPLNRAIPENEKKYPEPGMFERLPAYGFYIRHATDIRISDVSLHTIHPDSRPVFVLDDVKGISLDHVAAQPEKGAGVVSLTGTRDVRIFKSLGLRDAILPETGVKMLSK